MVNILTLLSVYLFSYLFSFGKNQHVIIESKDRGIERCVCCSL
jgi:hypothetical protein